MKTTSVCSLVFTTLLLFWSCAPWDCPQTPRLDLYLMGRYRLAHNDTDMTDAKIAQEDTEWAYLSGFHANASDLYLFHTGEDGHLNKNGTDIFTLNEAFAAYFAQVGNTVYMAVNAIDAQDQHGGSLFKILPDGRVEEVWAAVRYRLYNGIKAAPDGSLWLYGLESSAANACLWKLSPDGTISTYSFDSQVLLLDMAVDARGQAWTVYAKDQSLGLACNGADVESLPLSPPLLAQVQIHFHGAHRYVAYIDEDNNHLYVQQDTEPWIKVELPAGLLPNCHAFETASNGDWYALTSVYSPETDQIINQVIKNGMVIKTFSYSGLLNGYEQMVLVDPSYPYTTL